MKVEQPSQPGASQPPVARWLVWAVLILIGGTVVVPLVAALVFDAGGGLNMVLPGFLVFVVIAVIIACLQSASNPMHRRTDQMSRWREQFPAQSEPEIQRFLQVVGESLGLSKMHICKLSPDDRAADFEPLFGGMELVEMLMAVEEAYGLDLPDVFLNTCENLGQLFAYVTQHGTSRPVSAAAQQHDQSERAWPGHFIDVSMNWVYWH